MTRVLAFAAAAGLLLGVLNQAFDIVDQVAGWLRPGDDERASGATPVGQGFDNEVPTRCPQPTTDLPAQRVPPDLAGIDNLTVRLRVSPRNECDTVWALTAQPRATPCEESGRNCAWVWVVRRSDDKESIRRRQSPGTWSVFSFHLENDGGQFKACVAPVHDAQRVFCTDWSGTRL